MNLDGEQHRPRAKDPPEDHWGSTAGPAVYWGCCSRPELRARGSRKNCARRRTPDARAQNTSKLPKHIPVDAGKLSLYADYASKEPDGTIDLFIINATKREMKPTPPESGIHFTQTLTTDARPPRRFGRLPTPRDIRRQHRMKSITLITPADLTFQRVDRTDGFHLPVGINNLGIRHDFLRIANRRNPAVLSEFTQHA